MQYECKCKYINHRGGRENAEWEDKGMRELTAFDVMGDMSIVAQKFVNDG
jgi:hypothetical protein